MKLTDSQSQCFGGSNSGPLDVTTALNARGGAGRMDFESETFVTHSLRADGFDASEDGTGRGVPLIAVPILEAGARTGTSTTDTRAGSGIGEDGDPMFTLQSGKQHAVAVHGTQDPCVSDKAFAIGSNSGQENAIVFSCKDHGADAGEIAPTLRSMGHDGSHANAGGQLAVAIPEPYTLAIRGRGEGHDLEYRQDGVANALLTPNGGRGGIGVGAVSHAMAVRRLTVVECARLQGYPDTFLHIPTVKGRRVSAGEAAYLQGHGIRCELVKGRWRAFCPADGPMYKALGNSMAVPTVSWIGNRIRKALKCKKA